MKSKEKEPPFRVFGQRPISSTLLFRSSNRSTDCKEYVPIRLHNKQSKVSLSDFLDRKLHKGSVLPKSIQGKKKPFFSPIGGSKVTEPVEGKIDVNTREAEVTSKSVLDITLEQFKCTRKEGEAGDSLSFDDGVENSNSDHHDVQGSIQRKKPFEGVGEKKSTGKVMLTIGDRLEPKRKRNVNNYINRKKPRTLYNHYENGSGWWDCNMEGVDNEEVGCHDVWEGVGTTSIGGLEWN